MTQTSSTSPVQDTVTPCLTCLLLTGGGDMFGKHLGNRNAETIFVKCFGQKLLDHHDLVGFLRGQLGAIALCELLNGIAALLDRGGQRRQLRGFRTVTHC